MGGNKKKGAHTGLTILTVIITVLIIIPFAWMILLSFKTNTEIMNSPLSLPDKLNLDNFKMAFRTLPLGTMYKNTIIIVVFTQLI